MISRILPGALLGFAVLCAAGGAARAQLDRQTPQVMIEPRFVQIDRSTFDRAALTIFGILGGGSFGSRSLSEIGGNFDGRIGGRSTFAGGGGFEATLFTFGDITRPFGGVELQGRFGIDAFSARGQPVTQNGNQTGTVDRSQTNFLAGPQLRTMLVVTPQVNLDGYVYAQIGVAKVRTSGEPVNNVSLGGSDTALATRFGIGIDAPLGGLVRIGLEYGFQRTGSTNADRQAVALGGQFREGATDNHMILARIAFVGAIFRRQSSEQRGRELMIMVTPHLVRPAAE